MNQSEDYREYYKTKESAEEYDRKAYSKGTYASFLWEIEKKILLEFLISLRNTRDRIRYLDFACGTGRIVSIIENFVDESYGIDISQVMLDHAAKKTKRTILIQGDITKDDGIIIGMYDLITVFRFVLNAQPELREGALKILCSRMNSIESWLIFNMHANKYSYAFVSYLWYKFFGQANNKDTKRYLSRNDCIKIANDAGLDVIKIKGLGFISGRLFRVLPSLPLALLVEVSLSKLPLVNLLGTNLIFFCKRKGA